MFQETRRLAHITQILIKHGLYHDLFGESHYPPPKNVREAFEELGVVFLKFGQVLALRRDLLPAEYIRELESLHDRLPAMSAADVESVILREFGTRCSPNSIPHRSPRRRSRKSMQHGFTTIVTSS